MVGDDSLPLIAGRAESRGLEAQLSLRRAGLAPPSDSRRRDEEVRVRRTRQEVRLQHGILQVHIFDFMTFSFSYFLMYCL